MSQILYVVQPFSRHGNGLLAFDHPAYSRDRVFASALAQTLGRRKHGVLAVGALVDELGALAPEAEIIAGSGYIPTDLIFPGSGEHPLDTREAEWALERLYAS